MSELWRLRLQSCSY